MGTGATVEVSCKAGEKEIVAYGETKTTGKYSVTIKGFNYAKYGETACKAKLHMAPKGSACNIPTNLNGGNKGIQVNIKSKNHYLILLQTEPFAYASKTPYKECAKKISPPPPSPVPTSYYYTEL